MDEDRTDKILASLNTLVKEQAEMKTALEVHIAQSEYAEKIANENNRVLRGSEDKTGLIAQVKQNAEDIADAKRIISKIITPLIYAIGAGVLLLIIQGANITGFGG